MFSENMVASQVIDKLILLPLGFTLLCQTGLVADAEAWSVSPAWICRVFSIKREIVFVLYCLFTFDFVCFFVVLVFGTAKLKWNRVGHVHHLFSSPGHVGIHRAEPPETLRHVPLRHQEFPGKKTVSKPWTGSFFGDLPQTKKPSMRLQPRSKKMAEVITKPLFVWCIATYDLHLLTPCVGHLLVAIQDLFVVLNSNPHHCGPKEELRSPTATSKREHR